MFSNFLQHQLSLLAGDHSLADASVVAPTVRYQSQAQQPPPEGPGSGVNKAPVTRMRWKRS